MSSIDFKFTKILTKLKNNKELKVIHLKHLLASESLESLAIAILPLILCFHCSKPLPGMIWNLWLANDACYRYKGTGQSNAIKQSVPGPFEETLYSPLHICC